MDHQFKTNTVEKLTKLLKENYVFPETAVNIGKELIQRLHNNEFEGTDDPAWFAKLLTSQLQSISKDKHFQIRHSIEEPQVENPQEDKQIRRDKYLTRVKLDNYGFNKIERLPGNIGLLEFIAFLPPEHAGETASSAMTFLANTSCMIIDLRNNFGGSPHMVAYLSSYLLEPSPTHLNSLYWRQNEETHQFWSLPYVPGKRFGGTKLLYILTSRKTFSAAEEFTYNLQSIGRAVVVGERTGGGAHPGQVHRINKEFEVFIPSGRAINPVTKGNWEGAGVQPNIEVPHDKAFDVAYKMLLQEELKRLSDNSSSEHERIKKEIMQTLETIGEQAV